MSQCYSVIIYRSISAAGHGKAFVDGLNDVDKCYIYIYQLMYNIHIPVSNIFDSQMQMYTINQNNDESLAKEFQQHLKNSITKMVSLIR